VFSKSLNKKYSMVFGLSFLVSMRKQPFNYFLQRLDPQYKLSPESKNPS